MWNDTAEGRKLVEEISKTIVVAQVAPEELEYFDEMVVEYYESPGKKESGDNELGFGDQSWLTTITPVALPVVMTVLTVLGNEVLKNVAGKLAGSMVDNVKGYFIKTDQSPPPLTAEQVEKLKATALKTAEENGLGSAEAQKVAAALIGSLQNTA